MSINVDKVFKDRIYGKQFKKTPEFKKTPVKKESINPDLYAKGEKYFEVGGVIENIPEELKNNESFMGGYRHAERLAQIEEMQQGGKSK